MDSEDEVVRAHCLAEMKAKRRWAETVTDEWMAKASDMSKRMLEDALTLPIEVQAERSFEYFKMRTLARQGGFPIDRDAIRQWNAVIVGEEFEGNWSYWQRSYPEAAIRPSFVN